MSDKPREWWMQVDIKQLYSAYDALKAELMQVENCRIKLVKGLVLIYDLCEELGHSEEQNIYEMSTNIESDLKHLNEYLDQRKEQARAILEDI